MLLLSRKSEKKEEGFAGDVSLKTPFLIYVKDYLTNQTGDGNWTLSAVETSPANPIFTRVQKGPLGSGVRIPVY